MIVEVIGMDHSDCVHKRLRPEKGGLPGALMSVSVPMSKLLALQPLSERQTQPLPARLRNSLRVSDGNVTMGIPE